MNNEETGYDFLARTEGPRDSDNKAIFDVLANVARVYLFGYNLATAGSSGGWSAALGDLADRFGIIDGRIIELGTRVSEITELIKQLPEVMNKVFLESLWEVELIKAEGALITLTEMLISEQSIQSQANEIKLTIRDLRNTLNSYERMLLRDPNKSQMGLSFLTLVGPLYASLAAANNTFWAYVSQNPLLLKELAPRYYSKEDSSGNVHPDLLHTAWGSHRTVRQSYEKLLFDYDKNLLTHEVHVRSLFPDFRYQQRPTKPPSYAVFDFDGHEFTFSHWAEAYNLGGVLDDGRSVGRFSGYYSRVASGPTTGQVAYRVGQGELKSIGGGKVLVWFVGKNIAAEEKAKSIVDAREFFYRSKDLAKEIKTFRSVHSALVSGKVFL